MDKIYRKAKNLLYFSNKEDKNIKQTIGLDTTTRLKKLNALNQSKLKGYPSYARQLKKEDYLIDWNQNGRIILKKIHGLYPNAYTFYKGKRIKVLEVRTENLKESRSRQQQFSQSAVTTSKFSACVLIEIYISYSKKIWLFLATT